MGTGLGVGLQDVNVYDSSTHKEGVLDRTSYTFAQENGESDKKEVTIRFKESKELTDITKYKVGFIFWPSDEDKDETKIYQNQKT